MSTETAPGAVAPAPNLTDPLPVLPPHWWQDRSVLLAIAAGIVIIIVTGFLIRAALRRRTGPSPAALALAALAQAGDPVAVTRILRDYLAAVNPVLHTGLTVDELAPLATAGNPLRLEGWISILKECDAAKYAGASAPASLPERARELVLATEKHLAEAAAKRP